MLSYNNLFTKLTTLNSRLRTKADVAEKNNNLREKAIAKMDIYNANINVLNEKLSSTREMLKEINIASKEYRDSRKTFIEAKVEDALSLAFKDDYKVQITLTPYGDRIKGKLLLYTDGDEGERVYYYPKKQNGGLCRQTISLSSGLAIAELMGCHIVFMDEALNGGDSISMQKLQRLLVDFTADEDNQIILNEHNGSLYNNISCRRYDLRKEGKGQDGYVVIESVEDLIGENLDELEVKEAT